MVKENVSSALCDLERFCLFFFLSNAHFCAITYRCMDKSQPLARVPVTTEHTMLKPASGRYEAWVVVISGL